jgi:DnaJ-class molecular chaperone
MNCLSLNASTTELSICDLCDGVGEVDCLQCGGTGSTDAIASPAATCPSCAGVGMICCPECEGDGQLADRGAR